MSIWTEVSERLGPSELERHGARIALTPAGQVFWSLTPGHDDDGWYWEIWARTPDDELAPVYLGDHDLLMAEQELHGDLVALKDWLVDAIWTSYEAVAVARGGKSGGAVTRSRRRRAAASGGLEEDAA